jgi:DNA ligase (NAD+)
MSFKWQGQTATSVIREVTWATSRLGIVTPVAVIEPVTLSGAVITNVTLHNAAHVQAFDLKAGDQIEIVRSGEVIPKFLQVVEAAQGTAKLPKVCPSCQSDLVFDDVRLKCPNSETCPAQQLGSILNWIRAAEIDDLSEKRLAALMSAGLVRNMVDLYHLQLEDFFKIPQTKEKMAAKLFKNIDKSRHLPLARFLSGLGIEGAGVTTWEKLLNEAPNLKALLALTPEQIEAIEGFAEKTAEQIANGLQSKKPLIDALLAAGVKPEAAATIASDGPLIGKQLVITGSLSRPRAEIERVIKAAGGKVASAVSSVTHAVITEDPTSTSSKMQKARKLGIPVWSEADLQRQLGVD